MKRTKIQKSKSASFNMADCFGGGVLLSIGREVDKDVYIISCEFCDANSREGSCNSEQKSGLITHKYIFYDVNPPEGFNLRRDVYMRMAIFVRKLALENWFLVLPPWPQLYHWQEDVHQNRLPWSLFFNTSALKSFAPVVEMHEFLQTGQKMIDQVYVLQHFEDTFTAGNFDDRMRVESCREHLPYWRGLEGYQGDFWGYKNITAKVVECLSFHGPASQLLNIIKKTDAKTVMFDHAEVLLHDSFGDKTYWDARRSMIFGNHLIEEASRFRSDALNSSKDTDIPAGHPNEKRTALGGNYLCVHLRRKDFVRGRSKEVPSIKGASLQIEKALSKLNLNMVFVATDASEAEKAELKLHLKSYTVLMYNPSKEVKSKYKDGGVAIIEQIICSHARVFIGTHESTFSFRIQEEREIMGFQPETTFNRLCGDNEFNCRPPSKWLIVY